MDSINESRMIHVLVPTDIRFLVAIPVATPPVQCTIAANFLNQSNIVTGSSDRGTYCYLQSNITTPGLYNFNVSLRYVRDLEQSMVLTIQGKLLSQ